MRYHDITKADMKNGDGLRVVLWVSGCGHRCEGCQNPVTWDPYDGLVFDEAAKKEIFDELDKSYISGITLSGGDPLYEGNLPAVHGLLKEIREKYPNKTIWVYTGDTWESILYHKNWVLRRIDVLVEGEFHIKERDTKLMWKGSKNQRVIDVQASLKEGSVILHCGDYQTESNAGIPVTCSCGK